MSWFPTEGGLGTGMVAVFDHRHEDTPISSSEQETEQQNSLLQG